MAEAARPDGARSARPAAPRTDAPLLVELTRGGCLESVHRVHVAVADADGRLLAWAGDPDRVAFMRSSAKPLQALPLVASGAAARFGLQPPDLAVACGSHVGAAIHQQAVAALLARAGLDAGALRCGIHPPADSAAHDDLVRRGLPPERIHNNCSGKHAGMLVSCIHLGWPIESYLAPEHPLQRWITEIVASLGGVAPRWAPDGCGVPSFAIPLRAMATAYARLGSGAGLPPAWAEAASVLAGAMADRPELVSGPGRVNTIMLERMGRDVVTKGGAEGVWCAGLRTAGAAGAAGLAVKVEDGADRAAAAAAIAVARACAFPGAGDPQLDPFAAPVLRNTLGDAVGEMRVHLPPGFAFQRSAAGQAAPRVE